MSALRRLQLTWLPVIEALATAGTELSSPLDSCGGHGAERGAAHASRAEGGAEVEMSATRWGKPMLSRGPG